MKELFVFLMFIIIVLGLFQHINNMSNDSDARIACAIEIDKPYTTKVGMIKMKECIKNYKEINRR